jgi:hypothetical protein
MVTAAFAVSIGTNVSLTLVKEDGTWRFGSWYRHAWHELPRPAAADLAKRFVEAADGAEHFRALLRTLEPKPAD